MATLSAAPKPYVSPKAKAQQWWLFVHRWLGIALLIPMALLGLTGSALVWPSETELLLNPQRSVSDAADPALINASHIDAASEGLLEYGPITAALIGEVGQPLVLGTAPVAPPHMGLGPPTRMAAYVDPASARLLDTKRSTGDFMWFMHATHGHLLLSGAGRPLVGFMGLFLIISATTGLVVWWPGRKKMLAALKWRKWEGKMLNIHRQSGVVLSLVLIVEAFTGAWISFPTFFAGLVEPAGEQTDEGSAAPPRTRTAQSDGPASLPVIFTGAQWEAALARAQTAYPGRPVSIQVPGSTDGEWQFMMIGAQGPAELRLPIESGEPTIDYRTQTAGTAIKTAYAMDAVHAAKVGGPIWQWLTFLSGFVLAFLSFSGFYVWGKRQLKRQKRT